ncbi:FG-GAP-like repeat-containing protein [Actinokineospora cianjurensis]|uniref:Trypsin n=1 Tax=Actinokineospora cianjurensis TaxID=585224 RepID=A0A421B3J6_9PSEU|nr:FG-GAP-like repeat-containing protein [Actinokineospora cianjurensis]RLK58860.1 trypsin [Actinokineospora cianjurensis]
MRLRRIMPVAVVAVVLGGGAPVVAVAERPVVSDPVVAAMGRDLGFAPEQVAPRLAKEAAGGRLEHRVRVETGAAFAGAWLDAGAELVVAVTDEAAARTARAAGAKATVVRWSEQRLAEVKRGLDARRAAPDAVTGWYVDGPSNSVVVTATDPDAADVRAFAGTAPQIRITRATGKPQPLHDVRGGDAYYGAAGRCSIGFAVQGGFVTAGHCGAAGTATSGSNQVAQGTVERSDFPGDDMGWVRTNANWTPRPLVNNWAGGTVAVRGSAEAPVGASVCRSGSTTFWRCGTILAKDQTVKYTEEGVDRYVYGLTKSNACAEKGDSGGSWLAGDQAQGVTSGGVVGCTIANPQMYFQPVNEILQRYGLTLAVDTPPQPPATPESSVTGDFTGDGKADVLSLYDYGNSTTGLIVIPGTSGSGDSASVPYRTWLSGAGGFTWANAKITAGDFTGDGKTDVLALYDYGNSTTGLFVFPGTSARGDGASVPYRVWLSGTGGFTWANTKISAGDFTGDGKADLTALYDYGSSTTGLFVFPGTSGTGDGASVPRRTWLSAAGGFAWGNSKIATGDFTGDGKADVAALYDYGSSTSGLFIAPGTAATGDSASVPYRTWLSGAGGFTWGNTKVSAGDFTGDGKADVALFYDYGASTSGLWIAQGTGAAGDSASVPRRVWLSGPGGFTWSNAKVTAGDFTGDRKADVLALYDYGTATTGLWTFPGTAASGDSASAPYRVWLSGVGGWDWKRGAIA